MTLLRQPGAPMPCAPLFPAAATTVTPLATAFFTADERDENDASQLDDVPPLSAGDVLRLLCPKWPGVLQFRWFRWPRSNLLVSVCQRTSLTLLLEHPLQRLSPPDSSATCLLVVMESRLRHR